MRDFTLLLRYCLLFAALLMGACDKKAAPKPSDPVPIKEPRLKEKFMIGTQSWMIEAIAFEKTEGTEDGTLTVRYTVVNELHEPEPMNATLMLEAGGQLVGPSEGLTREAMGKWAYALEKPIEGRAGVGFVAVFNVNTDDVTSEESPATLVVLPGDRKHQPVKMRFYDAMEVR